MTHASNTACPDLRSDAAGRIWTGTTGSSSVHHWVSLGVPDLLARPDGRPDTKRPHVVEHLRQQLPVRPSNSAGEAQRLWRQRLAADWHAVCGPSKSTTPLSSLHCSRAASSSQKLCRRLGDRDHVPRAHVCRIGTPLRWPHHPRVRVLCKTAPSGTHWQHLSATASEINGHSRCETQTRQVLLFR